MRHKTAHRENSTRKNDQQKQCKTVCIEQAVGTQQVVKQGHLNDKVFSHIDDSTCHILEPGVDRFQEAATKKTGEIDSVKKHESQFKLLQSSQKKVKIAKDTQSLCSELHQKLLKKRKNESTKKEENLNLPKKKKTSHLQEKATENKLKVKKTKEHKMEDGGSYSEQASRTNQNIGALLHSEFNEREATVVNKDVLQDKNTEQHVLDLIVKDITLLETVIAEAEVLTSVNVSKKRDVKKQDKHSVYDEKTSGDECDVNMKNNTHSTAGVNVEKKVPKKIRKKGNEGVIVNQEHGTNVQRPKEPKKSKLRIETFMQPAADAIMDAGSDDVTHKDGLNNSSFSRVPEYRPRHPQEEPIFNKSAQIHPVVQLLTEEAGCDVRELRDVAGSVQHVTWNASQETIMQGSRPVAEKRKPVFQVNKKRASASAVVRGVDEE